MRSQSANGEEEGKLFASLIPGIFLSRVFILRRVFPGGDFRSLFAPAPPPPPLSKYLDSFLSFFPRRHQHPDGTRMRFFDYSRRLKKHLGKGKGEISLVHFLPPSPHLPNFARCPPPPPRRNSSCIFERRATEKRCKYAPR